MKPSFNFIKTTIAGGVLFLLPVVVCVFVIGKALEIVSKLIAPIESHLPHLIFGFKGTKVVAILVLVLLCFLAGLLFRLAVVQKWSATMDNHLHTIIPGYALIKSLTSDMVGQQNEQGLIPILFEQEDGFNLALLVEEGEKYATIFIPDAPRHDAGEVKIVATNKVKKLDMTTKDFIKHLKDFGKGMPLP